MTPYVLRRDEFLLVHQSDTVETRLTELETMRNQLQTQQAEYLSYQTHLEDLLNLDFAEDDQNIEIAEVIELKTNNRMH